MFFDCSQARRARPTRLGVQRLKLWRSHSSYTIWSWTTASTPGLFMPTDLNRILSYLSEGVPPSRCSSLLHLQHGHVAVPSFRLRGRVQRGFRSSIRYVWIVLTGQDTDENTFAQGRLRSTPPPSPFRFAGGFRAWGPWWRRRVFRGWRGL